MKVDNKLIASLRKDYKLQPLNIEDVSASPITQFAKWFEEALKADINEPNAMTVATASKNGIPSARILLLKGFDKKGFVFYTNYNGKKGKELMEHPNAAIVFCWLPLERQIRIEGSVEQVSAKMSTQYFQSRPKGSQIGAWASPQSTIIDERRILEENVKDLQVKYKNKEVLPRPKHWGGYRVKPHLIEFWQGRSSRLHDRIQYQKQKNGKWTIDRLAP